MFKHVFRKYIRFHNEPKKSRKSKKCEKKATEEKYNDSLDKNGIVVSKTNSIFSGSAVKLILDNMASSSDIETILETEINLRNGYINRTTECEFCHQKWNRCRVCCFEKEQEIHLLNEALQKLNSISHYKNRGFLSSEGEIKPCQKCLKVENAKEILEDLAKNKTFKKIRNKMRNMEKYYPRIYNHNGSIIEKWGDCEIEDTVKPEILDLDAESSSLFWI